MILVLSLLLTLVLSLAAVITPTAADAEPTAAAAPPQTVRNPLREGVADPWLFVHQGSYYLTYTTVDRIVLVRAQSVAELATAPSTTIWQDSGADRCCHIWAPEIHFINGKFYVYYTAQENSSDFSKHRMFVLESTGSDPMGPYAYKAKLATQNDFSIDGTVLTMPDGSLYQVWSGHLNGGPQNLYIAPMGNPWTLSGPPSLLSQATYPWETHGAINEGPTALRRGNKTYVVFSGSGCSTADYALGTLEYLGGDVVDQASWKKSTTAVFQRNDANWVFGPGHNSFFTSPDGSEVWSAYHAVTSSSGAPYGSCGGDRTLRINKVTFAPDGTPDFGVPSASWQNVALPAGDPGAAPVTNGTYRIAPKNIPTGALDVLDCSETEGAQVSVWQDVASSCQRWQLTNLDDGTGTYKIINTDNGLALHVAGCSAGNGGSAVQFPYSGSDCQRWYVDRLPGGYVRISSKISGRSLDVVGCANTPRVNVGLWNYWQGDCQKWRLNPV
ncbi:family 43 glycosylhydrolase [Microlunatus speluncae]|uniref:family 43 glycosylhydrolase n=1 Tax=Microlunatus speluncae TaxID=2594267 RepID=UPI0013754A68|nr:family 43 glycosylhydrolase [Microlunatus speluncae]